MNFEQLCQIWRTPATVHVAGYDKFHVNSARAGGEYVISHLAVHRMPPNDQRYKANLSSWLVEQRQLGNSCPEINVATLDDVRTRKGLRVSERADRILRCIDGGTSFLGEDFQFRKHINLYENVNLEQAEKSYFELLAYSESVSEQELLFLLSYLKSCGLIEHLNVNNPLQSCKLTFSGHERIAALQNAYIDSSRAFVAMWFDNSMEDAWKLGIEPAVIAAGYRPIRIDKQEHTNKIDDEIVAEIRRSRYVIADFTHGTDGARGGVYYEAGFAHGLGIPVIFSCNRDIIDNIHFDTRQYNHIVWDEPDELQERLHVRICAVIGEGPLLTKATR